MRATQKLVAMHTAEVSKPMRTMRHGVCTISQSSAGREAGGKLEGGAGGGGEKGAGEGPEERAGGGGSPPLGEAREARSLAEDLCGELRRIAMAFRSVREDDWKMSTCVSYHSPSFSRSLMLDRRREWSRVAADRSAPQPPEEVLPEEVLPEECLPEEFLRGRAAAAEAAAGAAAAASVRGEGWGDDWGEVRGEVRGVW